LAGGFTLVLQSGFFEMSDRRSDLRVLIVNDTFADHNFPGGSPLGARLEFGQLDEGAIGTLSSAS
jgi:hypothetical protein